MVEIVTHNLTIEADNGSRLSNIDLTLQSPNVVAFCSDDPLLVRRCFHCCANMVSQPVV